MAAHYLTRLGLGYRLSFWERQTVQVKADRSCCIQSWGKFKIQNSRFQRPTFQRLKAHFGIFGTWSLESGISILDSWNLDSWLLESRFL